MKAKHLIIAIYLMTGGLFFLGFAGCASFPGKELPKYSFEQFNPPARKPSIDYEAIFLAPFLTPGGQENPAAVRFLEQEVEKVFAKTNLFQKFGTGIGSADYHFKIVLKNEGKMSASVTLNAILSGVTMTLIPCYAKDEFYLSAEVNQGHQFLKKYEYRQHIGTWFQLFLIFLTPTHHPNKVLVKTIDNMLLNFLHDLIEDKIIETHPGSSRNDFYELVSLSKERLESQATYLEALNPYHPISLSLFTSSLLPGLF